MKGVKKQLYVVSAAELCEPLPETRCQKKIKVSKKNYMFSCRRGKYFIDTCLSFFLIRGLVFAECLSCRAHGVGFACDVSARVLISCGACLAWMGHRNT